MKLLCTGDLHINDWMPFSEIDKTGRPSRLNSYLKLATLIGKTALEKQCDYIIIAGDISEKSIQRPRVLDTIGDFLRIVSSFKPVHLIHGQHDCDSKETRTMRENSILTEICKDLEGRNVTYYGTTQKVDLAGYSFLFHPWTEDHNIPEEEADVFVGHGMVTGCTNLDGYVFLNGFKTQDLLDKFKVSIIGDIHKKQLHKDEFGPNIVLQPGAPIQNTWKDDPDCGIWTLEFNKEDPNITTEFFNIHELFPNTFHQFMFGNEEGDELKHYRNKVKLKKTKSEALKDNFQVSNNNDLIQETCISLIEKEKDFSFREEALEKIPEIFQEVDLNSEKVISKTKVLSIKAENFLSIDNLELNLDEFPHSCVICGKNGSGKTTLPEAIYWCLTGNLTKNGNISDIINQYNEAKSCKVSVKLEVNNQEFTVVRERKNSSSKLVLLDKDGEPHRAGSIRETQKDLYTLLGLQDWQIQMFSYFSAEKTSIFSELGSSSKNTLISQIVGLDFIESMREYSKGKKISQTKENLKLSGRLSEKNQSLKINKNKLEIVEKKGEDLRPKIEAEISTLKNSLVLIRDEMEELEINYTNSGGKSDEEMKELEKRNKSDSIQYFNLQSMYENQRSNKILFVDNARRVQEKLSEALKGNCSLCGQELVNNELVDKLTKELQEEKSKIKSLPKIEEIEEKLTKFNEHLELYQEQNKLHIEFKNTLLSKESEEKSLKLDIAKKEAELKDECDLVLLNHLKEEIEEIEKEISSLFETQIELEKQMSVWEFLETKLFKKNGTLIKELNKKGSQLIQLCINEVIPNKQFKLKINQDLNLTGIFYNKKEISYDLMSSGQKRLTDIVLMVSLNNLFSKLYKLPDGVLGISIYDEILSFLDERYIELAKNIVDQSMSRKVLVITHDYGLMNMYDSKISVGMTDVGSSYKKSWKGQEL